MSRFQIHKEHGFQVLDMIMARFQSGGYPYSRRGVEPPQREKNLPKIQGFTLGGYEHAQFLFAVCYYMRNMDSHVAMRAMTRVYEERPDLFDPRHGQYADPMVVSQLLLKHKLSYDTENVGGYWVENARRIVALWGGDIRNLFDGVTAYDVALERIQNRGRGRGFFGFQEKMTSMLIYFLMDAGMIPRWVFPPPIDFHINRLVFANEIVTLLDVQDMVVTYNPKLLASLRGFFQDYLQARGACPLELADALWLLSRTLCRKNPGNVSHLVDKGKGGRDRKHRSATLTWTPGQLRSYKKSCWSCPVETKCRWNIPALGRYVKGGILLRSRRERAPILHF